MKPQNEDLRSRTKHYALRIIKLYLNLPRVSVALTLGKQLLRSGTSVGANYREANRARSKAEFISKIGECLKEADETLYWLELLTDENVLARTRVSPLLREANELVAILVAISKRARGD